VLDHQHTHERFLKLAERVTFPGLHIEVIWDTFEGWRPTTPEEEVLGDFTVEEMHLGHYLRVSCPEGSCNVTAQALPWVGRKWRLSQHMTDMEFILTALKAVLTGLEHEARETFLVDGVAVGDSHLDLDAYLLFVQEHGGHQRTHTQEPSNG
jgi:hypothetical protein